MPATSTWTDPRSWQPGYVATTGDFNNEVFNGLSVANRKWLVFRSSGSISSGIASAPLPLPLPVTAVEAWPVVKVASTSGSVVFNVLRETISSPTTSALPSLFASSSDFITLTSGVKASTVGFAVASSMAALTTDHALYAQCVTSGSSNVYDFNITISVTGA